MRHLIAALMAGGSLLAYRWGMGISTPYHDRYYLLRLIGWCERLLTRLDAALSRLKVQMVDRLELDVLAWERLRRRYTIEMS